MDSEEPLRTWIVAYADRLVRLAYTYVQDQSTAETFARPFMERLFPGLVLCPIIERDSAVNDHSKIAPNHWSTVAVLLGELVAGKVAQENGVSQDTGYSNLRWYIAFSNNRKCVRAKPWKICP